MYLGEMIPSWASSLSWFVSSEDKVSGEVNRLMEKYQAVKSMQRTTYRVASLIATSSTVAAYYTASSTSMAADVAGEYNGFKVFSLTFISVFTILTCCVLFKYFGFCMPGKAWRKKELDEHLKCSLPILLGSCLFATLKAFFPTLRAVEDDQELKATFKPISDICLEITAKWGPTAIAMEIIAAIFLKIFTSCYFKWQEYKTISEARADGRPIPSYTPISVIKGPLTTLNLLQEATKWFLQDTAVTTLASFSIIPLIPYITSINWSVIGKDVLTTLGMQTASLLTTFTFTLISYSLPVAGAFTLEWVIAKFIKLCKTDNSNSGYLTRMRECFSNSRVSHYLWPCREALEKDVQEDIPLLPIYADSAKHL